MPINFDNFCVAKRGPGKANTHFNINDYYKYYKKTVTPGSFQSKYRTINTSHVVTEEVYKKVLRDYFSLLVQKIVMESKVIKIPLLGDFSIRKKKMNFAELSSRTGGLKIDYKKSKEARTIVHFTNDHRNNYSYRFYWQKMVSNLYLVMYTFRPNRQNKRLLAHILKNNMSIDYHEVKFKIQYYDPSQTSQL